MPNPKHYIDGNHTYVRGYVRRKRLPRKTPGVWGILLTTLILGCLAWFIFQVLKALWPILITIIFIGGVIYIITHKTRWRRRRLEKEVRKLEEEERNKQMDFYFTTRLEDLRKRK